MTIEFSYFSHKVCGQTIEQLFSLHRKKRRKEFKSPFSMLWKCDIPFYWSIYRIWCNSMLQQKIPIFLRPFFSQKKRQFLIKFQLKLSYSVNKKLKTKLLFTKVSTFYAQTFHICWILSHRFATDSFSTSSTVLYELLPNMQDKYFCCALFAFFYQFDSNLESVVFIARSLFILCFASNVSSFKIYIRWNLFIHLFLFLWLREISLEFIAVFSFFLFFILLFRLSLSWMRRIEKLGEQQHET